jgi:hypothetical protein
MNIQPIKYAGQVAAVVIDDQAKILAEVPEDDVLHIKTMCVYAMEIAAGERPGPYSDRDAEVFARRLRSRQNANTRPNPGAAP